MGWKQLVAGTDVYVDQLLEDDDDDQHYAHPDLITRYRRL
ncbi:uncharacterized, partial [Tachysurus ichikawai]